MPVLRDALTDIDAVAGALRERISAAGGPVLEPEAAGVLAIAAHRVTGSVDPERLGDAVDAALSLGIGDSAHAPSRPIDERRAHLGWCLLSALIHAEGTGLAVAMALVPSTMRPRDVATHLRVLDKAARVLDPRAEMGPRQLLAEADRVLALIAGGDSRQAVGAELPIPPAVRAPEVGGAQALERLRLPALALRAAMARLDAPGQALSRGEQAAFSAVRNGFTDDLPGSPLHEAERSVQQLGVWVARAIRGERSMREGNPLEPLIEHGHLDANLNIIQRQYHTARAASGLAALFDERARAASSRGERDAALDAGVRAAVMHHWAGRPMLTQQLRTAISRDEARTIAVDGIGRAGIDAGDAALVARIQDEVAAYSLDADLLVAELETLAGAIAPPSRATRPALSGRIGDTRSSPRFAAVHVVLDRLDATLRRMGARSSARDAAAGVTSHGSRGLSAATDGSGASAPGAPATSSAVPMFTERERDVLIGRLTALRESVIRATEPGTSWTFGDRDARGRPASSRFEDPAQRRADPLGYLADATETFQLGSVLSYGGQRELGVNASIGLLGTILSILYGWPVVPRGQLGGRLGREGVVEVGVKQNAGEFTVGVATQTVLGGRIGIGGTVPVGVAAIAIAGEGSHDAISRELRGVSLRVPRTGVAPGAAPGVFGDAQVAARLAEVIRTLSGLLSSRSPNVLLTLMADFPELSVGRLDDWTETRPSRLSLSLGLGPAIPAGPVNAGVAVGTMAWAYDPRIIRAQHETTGYAQVDRNAEGWATSIAAVGALGPLFASGTAIASGATPLYRDGAMTGTHLVRIDGQLTMNTHKTEDAEQAAAFAARIRADLPNVLHGLIQADARRAEALRAAEHAPDPVAARQVIVDEMLASVERHLEGLVPGPNDTNQVFSLPREGTLHALDTLHAIARIASEAPAGMLDGLAERADALFREIRSRDDAFMPAYLVALTKQHREATKQWPHGLHLRGGDRAASSNVTDIL